MSSTMPHPKFDPAERRTAVRRTALILAAIAIAMFVGFILNATLR
jgi:hypothetical protein